MQIIGLVVARFMRGLLQVLAEFEFIKKLDDTTYCKEWLRIMPFSGCIRPGEYFSLLFNK